MSVAIKFSNVRKRYPYYHSITGGIKNFLFNLPTAVSQLKNNSFTALDGISFEIQKGEAVGIIGRNGAGKSTTLGLIARVLKANEGTIEVNGRISPLLELGGGFHPDLTGLENMKLNGVLMGLSRKKVSEKLDTIIEFSELGEFIHHPIRTYSSGMVARLGFSIVAHLDPEILLIDETLAVGDSKFQKKCISKISEFKNQGITIVLVSHSSKHVEEVCERAIWIDKHKIKLDGPAEEVLKKYHSN